MVEVVEPADPLDDPSAAEGWAAKSKIGVFPPAVGRQAARLVLGAAALTEFSRVLSVDHTLREALADEVPVHATGGPAGGVAYWYRASGCGVRSRAGDSPARTGVAGLSVPGA
jgi:hypothetical protein